MISILFLLIQLGFAILIFFLALAFLTGAPFVPSTKATSKAMIDLAQIKPGMKVYDLGSGDGRLLILAAKKGAKAVGLEINPFLVLLTQLKIFWFSLKGGGLKGVTHGTNEVRWQSFWNANLSEADVIFVYLLPWKMEALARKLQKELKPGSLVISNSFIFPKWKILRQDTLNHVYVFRV